MTEVSDLFKQTTPTPCQVLHTQKEVHATCGLLTTHNRHTKLKCKPRLLSNVFEVTTSVVELYHSL